MTDSSRAASSTAIPTSDESRASGRLYSPAQVAAGAFLGGPVGLIYFLKANFASLGNARFEKATLAAGGALVLALLAILPVLPEKFPSAVFSLAYMLVGRRVAEKHQMTRQAISESPHHEVHSNWRVAGVGLLCGLASFVVLVGPLTMLSLAGVWRP